MKSRDVVLASTAAGVLIGGAAWLLTRKHTEVHNVETVYIGDRFPTMMGTTLSGQALSIPDDVAGDVTVLIMADDYDARSQVEQWTGHVLATYGELPALRVYQVALISGIGPIMRKVIDAAMVRATPEAEHSHVITVYGDLREFRAQLAMHGQPEAHVFVLDRDGKITWRADGPMAPDRRVSFGEALNILGVERIGG